MKIITFTAQIQFNIGDTADDTKAVGVMVGHINSELTNLNMDSCPQILPMSVKIDTVEPSEDPLYVNEDFNQEDLLTDEGVED